MNGMTFRGAVLNGKSSSSKSVFTKVAVHKLQKLLLSSWYANVSQSGKSLKIIKARKQPVLMAD
jgi:hypothetical protein